MKNLLVFISIFLLLLSSIYSQNTQKDYYNVLAKYYEKQGEYNKQAESLLKLVPFNHSPYLYIDIAEAYIKGKQYIKAEEILNTGIKHGLGLQAISTLQDYPNFNSLRQSIIINYNKEHIKFYSKFKGNLLYEKFLIELLTSDQTNRSGMDFTHWDSLSRSYTLYNDSISIDTFYSYYKKYGLPSILSISTDCHYEVLFLHWLRYTSNKKVIELDEAIKKSCKAGLQSSSFYALGKDQTWVLDSNYTYYGVLDEAPGGKIVNVFDIKNIDKRRLEIGLSTLYEEYLFTGKSLPNDYIIPKDLERKYKSLQIIKK